MRMLLKGFFPPKQRPPEERAIPKGMQSCRRCGQGARLNLQLELEPGGAVMVLLFQAQKMQGGGRVMEVSIKVPESHQGKIICDTIRALTRRPQEAIA